MANRPTKINQQYARSLINNSRLVETTYQDVLNTNIESTGSFIYDPVGSPLKSTQQLVVDWSRFENHTFFMSAVVKVNVAFDKIINGYPFDGTAKELETFFETLTGYEKWIFDSFPKYTGALHFTSGSYIVVNDVVGATFPEISKNKSGKHVLNPDVESFSIEFHISLPEEANSTSIILQKLDSDLNEGYQVTLLNTVSTTTADLQLSIINGSYSNSVTVQVGKGAFKHVCFVVDRDEQKDKKIKAYVNGVLESQSNKFVSYNRLSIDKNQLTIGSGSAYTLDGSLVTPTTTFSGTLDELRLWKQARTDEQIKKLMNKSTNQDDSLVLYYKFNEPQDITLDELDEINSIVLDSSGNGLHSYVTNYTGSFRINVDNVSDNLMMYEKDSNSPILFPTYSQIVDLNENLINSASSYDLENPNLITNLVPPHFFQEGAAYEGFEDVQGTSNTDYYNGSGIPGQGSLGTTQLLTSMLYIYAQFFDELKMFIDAFKKLKYVSYDEETSIPDNFLLQSMKSYGFDMPLLFNDSTIEQYVYGDNIDQDVYSTDNLSLKKVQSALLRRILTNIRDLIVSKGTQHSIRSFLRCIGIDPDNSIKIKEHGGPTKKQLKHSREQKKAYDVMAQFFSSSYVYSPFLSGSRVEVGYPNPRGTFVDKSNFVPHGISNQRDDGQYTSGSWSVEGIYKWTPALKSSSSFSSVQSLGRLNLTGSAAGTKHVYTNLLAVSASNNCRLELHVRFDQPLHVVTLNMDNEGLFDCDKWNVCWGVIRPDDPYLDVDTYNSCSWFIKASKQEGGEITSYYSTSSIYNVFGTTGINAPEISSDYNASGSFFTLGSGDVITAGTSGAGYVALNDTTNVNNTSRIVDFNGLVSQVRFWSKALSDKEFKEHTRNYLSVGVDDPSVNWNYNTTRSGSFERLRMNTIASQEIRQAEATGSIDNPIGSMLFLDFSENNNHLRGLEFPIETLILKGELYDYSYLSPSFDEAVTNEKIRVRSYNDIKYLDEYPYANLTPVHEIRKTEEPNDDTRFSLEMSLIDALNQDIMTVFSSLESFDNYLGDLSNMYSLDYPDLDRMRDVYFNRIKDKLNFKLFFEYFRWFDTSISTFIEQLIPRKTKYKGCNFVIESHVLERHKNNYYGYDAYLSERNKQNLRDVLLLQQLVGTIRKF